MPCIIHEGEAGLEAGVEWMSQSILQMRINGKYKVESAKYVDYMGASFSAV